MPRISIKTRLRAAAWQLWVALNLLLWVPPAWVLVVALPGLRLRRAVGAAFVRAMLWLFVVRVRVLGEWPLAAQQPCVLVANHGSYLDGVLLTGYMPVILIYVAKQELGGFAPMRWMLQRLGTRFVDRADARAGSSVVFGMTQTLATGRSILVFPEGGFETDPGLGAFKLGAFLAASRARVAVVPVAINGARQVYGGNKPRARRGEITLVIGPALGADAADSQPPLTGGNKDRVRNRARWLASESRRWIATNLDEPDRTR